MSKPKRKRWDCPNGEHAGVLAPGRLRKIDVRRYCLDCSVDAGVLVERTCKANAKKAEASKARSSRKAQSKRSAQARAREQAKQRQRDREVINGIDIAREVDRVWAHALKLQGENMHRRKVPMLSVSRRSDGATSGRAWSSGRIHLSIGEGASRPRIVGVIAHEVAHHMAWGDDHNDRFWSCLAELVLEAYGTEPARLMAGKHWEKQRAIEDGIELSCEWLHAEPLKLPRKPAAPRAGRAAVESVREAATGRAGGRARRRRSGARGGSLEDTLDEAPRLLSDLLKF